MNSTAHILLAHGSRDACWRAGIESVAAAMQGQQPGVDVQSAYIELCEPTLGQAVAQAYARGARRLVVTPMFLGLGKHGRSDIPALLEAQRAAFPDLHFTLQPIVGEHPALIDLLARLALERPAPSAA